MTVANANATNGYGAWYDNADLNTGDVLRAPHEFITGTQRVDEKSHGIDRTTDCKVYQCPRWWYQIGTEKIPDQYVDTFARSYRYLQEAVGRFGDVNYTPMDLAKFSSRGFIMAANFENDEASLSGMQYTGRSLYLGNSLTLQLEGLSAPGSTATPNIVVTAYLLFTRILVIRSQNVEVQE